MQHQALPVPLARVALNLLPDGALTRGLDGLMRHLARRHAKLFRNLEAFKPARVLFVPTDLHHLFALSFGKAPAQLEIFPLETPRDAFDAVIEGRLGALLSLLEGQEDGDTLFFARALKIAGDTSVIVALRNTIDREEVDLLEDLLAFSGPFAGPARLALRALDRLGRGIRAEMELAHEGLHASDPKSEGLRAQVEALKRRLDVAEGKPDALRRGA